MANRSRAYRRLQCSVLVVGFLLATLISSPALAEYFRMQGGSFTGSEVDNRNIALTGSLPQPMTPDAIFVKADAGQRGVVWTSTMGGGSYAKDMYDNTALELDLVQGSYAGGFQVGAAPRTNNNGSTIYYQAFQSDTSNMVVGLYTGNGTNNRNINFGFQPAAVLLMVDSTYRTYFLTQTMGTVAYDTNGDTTSAFNNIHSQGFQVDLTFNVNTSAIYHYIAWKEVAGLAAESSYTGDGNDNRNITGLGLDPAFVLVQRNNSTSEGNVRMSTYSGDQSGPWTAAAFVINKIQAFSAYESGGNFFQVGTNAQVNNSGSPNTYYYFAIKETHYTATSIVDYRALLLAGDAGVEISWALATSSDIVNVQVQRRGDADFVNVGDAVPPNASVAGGNERYTVIDEAGTPEAEYQLVVSLTGGGSEVAGPFSVTLNDSAGGCGCSLARDRARSLPVYAIALLAASLARRRRARQAVR